MSSDRRGTPRCPFRLGFAALLLMWATGPLSAQTTHVDFDHDVDFSQYKTFSWSASQEPAANLANHVRITRAVERELEAKGLKKDDRAASGLTLRYVAKSVSKVRGELNPPDAAWQPDNLRTTVDLVRVREGTLILEFVDAKTGTPVWRAVGTDAIARPDLIEEEINTVVKKLLEGFPPKHSGS